MRVLAHISDLHFGRHDEKVAAGLLASLAGASAHLVAVSGDLTQRARRAEFAAARSFLDRIAERAPVLVVPGNHDVPLYNVLRRFFEPHDRFRAYVSAEEMPVHRDEEMIVLGLNTARARAFKNGRLSRGQVAEIRAGFAGLPERCWKVLVTHHPLGVPVGGAADLETVGRSRRALEAVDEAGIHLLLSGHYHRSSTGEAAAPAAGRRSVLLVHAGTAISVRTREEENSYNLVRLERDTVEVEVLSWQGRAFAAAGAKRYRFADGRWVAD